ncbi:unnamed protein product [Arctia plantaginis]|uniref:Uncharacterized protein n=1 Tax=Arctia plantaginis TaxID=874455 RepID=A0A8S0ZVR9_ARCPL|nr:unnamed protein product [Arctia plantaginis]
MWQFDLRSRVLERRFGEGCPPGGTSNGSAMCRSAHVAETIVERTLHSLVVQIPRYKVMAVHVDKGNKGSNHDVLLSYSVVEVTSRTDSIESQASLVCSSRDNTC